MTDSKTEKDDDPKKQKGDRPNPAKTASERRGRKDKTFDSKGIEVKK